DRVNGEDFLFADAQEVVVVGGAEDDGARRVVEVGRLIDDNGRVARTGDDGSLRAAHRRSANGGTARDTEHLHVAVIEDGLGRLQRRRLDDGDQVVDADGLVDRLVEQANALAGDASPARVRVAHQGVAGGQHVDGVAGEGRQRVRYGSNNADDA